MISPAEVVTTVAGPVGIGRDRDGDGRAVDQISVGRDGFSDGVAAHRHILEQDHASRRRRGAGDGAAEEIRARQDEGAACEKVSRSRFFPDGDIAQGEGVRGVIGLIPGQPLAAEIGAVEQIARRGLNFLGIEGEGGQV